MQEGDRSPNSESRSRTTQGVGRKEREDWLGAEWSDAEKPVTHDE